MHSLCKFEMKEKVRKEEDTIKHQHKRPSAQEGRDSQKQNTG